MHHLLTLPENRHGRDFMVADLHGQYDLLQQKLDEAQFNPFFDRLLSGGDLVDRGLRSMDCLRLIREPWFNYVLGNHELMLLCFFGVRDYGHHSVDYYLETDGAWLNALTPDELIELRDDLIPRLKKAPLILVVEHKSHPFQVVHAELMDPYQQMLHPQLMTDRDILMNHESLTWGRSLLKSIAGKLPSHVPNELDVNPTAQPWEPGLPLTYVGHSIVDWPILHRSHLYIDRGAFRRNDPTSDLLLIEHAPFVEKLLRMVPRNE
jgi:serine/threonine protein phosphatase 1